MSSQASPPSALPDGACLLHIGPPKTGTTSLQSAFWAARREALAQGVRYAGRSRHESQAALAVARSLEGAPDRPTITLWNALADEVRRATEPRVVLSSEALSYADTPAAGRVVSELRPRRVHVVITLRPLGRILPSAWQQYVKGGLSAPYETWLDLMLNQAPGEVTPLFWRQQRHDQLVARWAGIVGTQDTTVVVADDRDHDGLLRTFERLTGLREGTLAPVTDLANRSLTAAEVELVRTLGERLRAEGFTPRDIDRVVRGGGAEYMLGRAPDPSEPRIVTPQWALDRAGETAVQMVAAIRASGVRVIGDLDTLTAVPRTRQSEADAPRRDAEAATVAAAWLALGMYRAGRRDPDLDRVPARLLATVLARRIPAGMGRRIRRLLGRGS